MPLPPDPTVPDILLAVVARMGWQVSTRSPTGTELGYFDSPEGLQALFLDRGERWGIYSQAAPGLGPFLLSRATYDILHAGSLNADGSIAYECRNYRVQAIYEDGNLVAKALLV